MLTLFRALRKEQGGVAVAEEPVAAIEGVAINAAPVFADEGTHEEEQRAVGLVEVRYHTAHKAEAEARANDDARIGGEG